MSYTSIFIFICIIYSYTDLYNTSTIISSEVTKNIVIQHLFKIFIKFTFLLSIFISLDYLSCQILEPWGWYTFTRYY